MKHITVTDITLRKISASREAFGFRDKTETAKYLDSLHIDGIELGEITERGDILFCHTVSPILKNSTLSCNAGLTPEQAEKAYEAVSSCRHYRLYTTFPSSVVQMEYICRKKPAAMLELIDVMTAKLASFGCDTEAVFSDATRAEHDFLISAVSTAVKNGIKVITLCDDAGNMLPDEITTFVSQVISETSPDGSVRFQFESTDKLGLGTSLALAALRGGADGVKTSFTDGGTELASLVKLLHTCGDRLDYSCDVDSTLLDNVSKKIRAMVDGAHSEGSGLDNVLPSATDHTELLSEYDTISTVSAATKKLGYELSAEDEARVFEEFQKVAVKKQVSMHELDALIATVALQVPSTYKLKSFVINNGNILAATAHIELEKDGIIHSGVSVGDGPVDAAFLAIEQIIGHHFELDDFQIQSLTEGRGAVGSSIVKLRADSGKLYSGKGVSTDIIGAAIKAYINALNKICFEEE